VLRDGAGERAGVAPGDELIAIDGWRLRRLDDATRVMAQEGTTTLLVGRDQRVLSLPIAIGSLAAADAGVVQLKAAEKADAAARRLREAWIGS
jgi:predicted metalloprotease with PDZ domain